MSQTIYFKYEVGSSEIHGIYYAINTNPFYFTTPSKYIENNSCYIVLIYYLVTHNHIFKFLISSTFLQVFVSITAYKTPRRMKVSDFVSSN
jgi:hypothetical protein